MVRHSTVSLFQTLRIPKKTRRTGEGLKKEDDMSGNGGLFSLSLLPLFPQFVFAGLTKTWN